MNAELEACNGITAGQADEYHATAGGRVFSWIDGRLGPVGHANLKIMQSTQAGISSPCGNALWTHGTDHGSEFPHRRQNTGLCDHLPCRGGERPHLSNTPSRRITDERDTGFHWALRRGGWGRTPLGNPSLGACLYLGFKQTGSSILYGDNQATVLNSASKKQSPKSKHFQIRTELLRAITRSGKAHILKIGTKDNLSDLYTKQMGTELFESLRAGNMGHTSDKAKEMCGL